MQGFHLEYLRSGDAQKQVGRGRKHGTMDRLLRLANDATLREELTSFPLAIDAEDAIPAAHRSGMQPGLNKLLKAMPVVSRQAQLHMSPPVHESLE